MAGIGFSKPKAALYSATGGVVSYTQGKTLGKGVELSLSLDGGDNANVLYADNAPAESDKGTFTGGTVSLTTDNLSPEIMNFLLGVTTKEEPTISGVTGVEISVDGIDGDAPYVGFGGIRKLQINNQIKWQAVVFTKVQFAAGDDDWTTQGETIEWQTPTIEASLMRDDATIPSWRKRSNYLDSEADAEKVLNYLLGITA